MLHGTNISKIGTVQKINNKLITHVHPNFVIIDDLKFWLDKDDSLKFCIRKNYPPNILHYLKIIKPGDTVIDVGANIGFYTLLFSRLVGNNGKVIAIEADQENYKLLKKNIDENKFKNIVALHNGVSDNTDVISLIRGNTIGEHKLSNQKSHDTNYSQVKCLKLDDICKDINKIKLLKSDTEGHEIHVLNGCKTLLEKNKINNIMIEFNISHLNYYKSKPKELFDILSNYGFNIFDMENETFDEKITLDYLMNKHKSGGTDLFCSKTNLSNSLDEISRIHAYQQTLENAQSFKY